MAKQLPLGKFNKLRKKAEKVLPENGENISRISSDKDIRELRQELSIHEIELEIQNDELRRSQEELEESRSRYIDLYDYAPVGYLTLDEKGVVSELNLTAAHLLGVERGFLIKKPFSAFIAPESRDVFYLHRQQVLSSDSKQTCELLLKRKEEGDRFFHAQLESIVALRNGAKAIRAILTDITDRKQFEKERETARQDLESKVEGRTFELRAEIADRKQAQEALRESEEKFRAVSENARAIFGIIQGGRFIYANPYLAELSGYRMDEILSMDFSKMIHPSFRDEVMERARKRLAGEPVPSHYEFMMLTKSGEARWLDFSPERIELNGRPAIIGTAFDITERKQAEEALRESERRERERAEELEAVLDAAPIPVFIAHDSDCLHLTANRAAVDLLGLPRGAETSLSAPDVVRPRNFKAFKDGRELTNEELPAQRAARGFPVQDFEFSLVFDDGAIRHVAGYGTPLRDEGGNPRGAIHALVDITERKQAEEALRRSRDELELRVEERTKEVQEAYAKLLKETQDRERIEEQLRHAQKMEAIGTLAGGIAHDFNNILAAIIGFTEMVLDDVAENPDAKRKMENVLKAGFRGRDLVKQILAFSRKTEEQRKEISLTPLMKQTHALLRSSLPSTIRMNLAITTGDDYVVANPTQVQQILMNLATNAAHAMPEHGGQLTIGVSSVTFPHQNVLPDPDMEPGTYVKLTMQDTGVGMTKEVRQRIFEPFFTTKKPGEGTGMGLAVVYGLVKDHKGTVTVQSEPGQGSTFEVFLPQVQRPDSRKKEATASALSAGTERILFVDDEELLVEMARVMLESLGYQVTVAQHPKDAWSLFIENPSQFDLIITDQTMPDMTGLTLARKMLKVRNKLPIILCTGYSETVSAEAAQKAGISAFVMKPVVRKELAETVRRVLDEKAAGA